MKDLTTVSTDLYNKVRSRFSNVKIGDAEGKVIADGNPANARFFELKYTYENKDLGSVVIKIDEKKLAVIFSNSMVEGDNRLAKDDWYAFLREMREFAMSNLLTFDTRDITKSNLDQRDFEYLAKENGENTMSESKLFGTSKTSYQDVGEARLIVKHSQPVNYNVPAGRTMHIESIYIESATGERFRYPHKHLNGARAMAMHIANGGTSYDQIGTHISSLSEELSKLRQFKNYTQRNGLSEALDDISERVISRIDSIKEEIARLQKQSYYDEFKESFQPNNEVIIPEETVDAWVDALTIRTFNEELKNVFPFIYRLVDQPKEITYEDLVSEEKCPECGMDPCDCDHDEEKETNEDSMFAEFEDQIDAITALDMDQPVDEESDSLVSKVAEIMKRFEQDAMEVGAYGEPDIEGIASLIAQGDYEGAADEVYGSFTDKDGDEPRRLEPYIQDLQDEFAALGDSSDDDMSTESFQTVDPRLMSQAIVEFVKSMYNREDGTFPRGEEGVQIAVEKRFGEQAGQFAAKIIEALKSGM